MDPRQSLPPVYNPPVMLYNPPPVVPVSPPSSPSGVVVNDKKSTVVKVMILTVSISE